MLGMIAGSVIGGYLPVAFGINAISFWSLAASSVGAIIGIYVIVKFTD
jgi:uncharacterized membrane protein YeaQ/YmgE (transglycosylase-associated protein family)